MDEQLLSNRSDEQLPSHSHRDEQPPSMAATFVEKLLVALGIVTCVALLASLCFIAWGLVELSKSRPPEFSVAIDGFSGIVDDPAPRAFNLTLGVDNLGGTFEVCVDGDAVVLYGGVPLAVGHVKELCVPPKGAGDQAVVAASGGVGVPEALAELMAGEKRVDGAVHVEVRVVPAEHSRFLSCTAALGQRPARPHPCKDAILVDESDGVRPDDI
ncbi:hypothetical protein ACP70R_011311 [Stipagrostis hirtigluma subsp. patula]